MYQTHTQNLKLNTENSNWGYWASATSHSTLAQPPHGGPRHWAEDLKARARRCSCCSRGWANRRESSSTLPTA